jgi:predicted GNAT superfamily acetyltransferase
MMYHRKGIDKGRIEWLRNKFFRNANDPDKEKEKLSALLKKGYLVEVVDPFAKTFSRKYAVFQNVGERKTVVIDDDGNPIAAQG